MYADWSKLEALVTDYQNAVEREDDRGADSVAGDILDEVVRTSDIESDPRLQWSITASLCEEAADWEGAERAYRESLRRAGDSGFGRYAAHADLAGLYALLKRDDAAREQTIQATAAAREADSTAILLMALGSEVRWLLRQANPSAAWPLINEMLSLVERETRNGLFRAQAYLARAECHVAEGHLDAAKADLDVVGPLLFRYADWENAAGAQHQLACYYLVSARRSQRMGELAAAAADCRRAVGIARGITAIPHADSVHSKAFLATTLDRLSEVWEDAGQLRRAKRQRREATRIRKDLGIPI